MASFSLSSSMNGDLTASRPPVFHQHSDMHFMSLSNLPNETLECAALHSTTYAASEHCSNDISAAPAPARLSHHWNPYQMHPRLSSETLVNPTRLELSLPQLSAQFETSGLDTPMLVDHFGQFNGPLTTIPLADLGEPDEMDLCMMRDWNIMLSQGSFRAPTNTPRPLSFPHADPDLPVPLSGSFVPQAPSNALAQTHPLQSCQYIPPCSTTSSGPSTVPVVDKNMMPFRRNHVGPVCVEGRELPPAPPPSPIENSPSRPPALLRHDPRVNNFPGASSAWPVPVLPLPVVQSPHVSPAAPWADSQGVHDWSMVPEQSANPPSSLPLPTPRLPTPSRPANLWMGAMEAHDLIRIIPEQSPVPPSSPPMYSPIPVRPSTSWVGGSGDRDLDVIPEEPPVLPSSSSAPPRVKGKRVSAETVGVWEWPVIPVEGPARPSQDDFPRRPGNEFGTPRQPWGCHLCNTGFRSERILRIHLTWHEREPTPAECSGSFFVGKEYGIVNNAEKASEQNKTGGTTMVCEKGQWRLFSQNMHIFDGHAKTRIGGRGHRG